MGFVDSLGLLYWIEASENNSSLHLLLTVLFWGEEGRNWTYDFVVWSKEDWVEVLGLWVRHFQVSLGHVNVCKHAGFAKKSCRNSCFLQNQYVSGSYRSIFVVWKLVRYVPYICLKSLYVVFEWWEMRWVVFMNDFLAEWVRKLQQLSKVKCLHVFPDFYIIFC